MAHCAPLLLLALGALLACCAGQDDVLQCYSCILTDGDDTCLNDPENAGNSSVVDCTLEPNKCCLIQRVDDNENLGTPLHFVRLCTNNCDPDKLGQMIESVDFSYTTYQTYCNESWCNDGPGNVSLGSGGVEIVFHPGSGGGESAFHPGSGGGESAFHPGSGGGEIAFHPGSGGVEIAFHPGSGGGEIVFHPGSGGGEIVFHPGSGGVESAFHPGSAGGESAFHRGLESAANTFAATMTPTALLLLLALDPRGR